MSRTESASASRPVRVSVPSPYHHPHSCVIPGLASIKKHIPLSPRTAQRMAWSRHNLLAHVCQQYIVVCDPLSHQRLITLAGHKGTVTSLLWFTTPPISTFPAPRASSSSSSSGVDSSSTTTSPSLPPSLPTILASGDDHGYIVFWNVLKGKKIYMFLEEDYREILQLSTLVSSSAVGGSSGSGSSHQQSQLPCLLSLAEGSYLSCWSLEKKKKMWGVRIADSDPHCFRFSLGYGFGFDQGMQLKGNKSGTGGGGPGDNDSSTSSPSRGNASAGRSGAGVRGLMCCSRSGWIYAARELDAAAGPGVIERKFRLTASAPSPSASPSSSSSSHRRSSSTVGGGDSDNIAGIARGAAVLRGLIFSPHCRDQLYLVAQHEISVFDAVLEKTLVSRKCIYAKSEFVDVFFNEDTPDTFHSLHADGSIVRWDWDAERESWKQLKLDRMARAKKISKDLPGFLLGVALSPRDDRRIAALDSNGRVYFWRLLESEKMGSPPKKATVSRRWVLGGLLESINGLLSCMAISPSRRMLAAGTLSGEILLFDMLTLTLKVRNHIFTRGVTVRGVEWASEDELIVFSNTSILVCVNVLNGSVTRIVRPQALDLFADESDSATVSGKRRSRRHHLLQGAPRGPMGHGEEGGKGILSVKVSPSRKYMVVVQRDPRPLEVWSLGDEWAPNDAAAVAAARSNSATTQTTEQSVVGRRRVGRRRLVRIVKMKGVLSVTWQPLSEAAVRRLELEEIGEVDDPMAPSRVQETFIVSKTGGSLHFFDVLERPAKVIQINENPRRRVVTYSSVSALARKGHFLVCGDFDGNLLIIAKGRETRTIATHKGFIRRIEFSPLESLVFVLFADGSFGIWDLAAGNRRATSTASRGGGEGRHVAGSIAQQQRGIAIGWTSNNLAIVATVSGTIVVYPTTLMQPSSSFMRYCLERPMKSAGLLPDSNLQFLKHALLNKVLCTPGTKRAPPSDLLLSFDPSESEGELATADATAAAAATDPHSPRIPMSRNCYGESFLLSSGVTARIHECLVDDDTAEQLRRPELTVSERSEIVCSYFGDPQGVQFWRLVRNFLPILVRVVREEREVRTSARLLDFGAGGGGGGGGAGGSEDGGVSGSSSDQLQTKKRFTQALYHSPAKTFDKSVLEGRTRLPGSFGIQRDRATVHEDELARVESYGSTVRKTGDYDLYGSVALQQSLVDEKDSAVSLLIETPAHHRDMCANLLHACVISASNSMDHFKQTVLLVSSNLFSFGNLDESKKREYTFLAAELLCLIGEGLKACKTLQNFEYWDDAARFAKTVLPRDECEVILVRWANHLERVGRSMHAMHVWLSLGCFFNVLRLLQMGRMVETAYLFALACKKQGAPLLTNRPDVDILKEGCTVAPPTEETDLVLHQVYDAYESCLARVGLGGVIEQLVSEERTEDGDADDVGTSEETKEWTVI